MKHQNPSKLFSNQEGVSLLEVALLAALLAMAAVATLTSAGAESSKRYSDAACAIWHGNNHKDHVGDADHCRNESVHDWFYE